MTKEIRSAAKNGKESGKVRDLRRMEDCPGNRKDARRGSGSEAGKRLVSLLCCAISCSWAK